MENLSDKLETSWVKSGRFQGLFKISFFLYLTALRPKGFLKIFTGFSKFIGFWYINKPDWIRQNDPELFFILGFIYVLINWLLFCAPLLLIRKPQTPAKSPGQKIVAAANLFSSSTAAPAAPQPAAMLPPLFKADLSQVSLYFFSL
jgi:hypothetical protein